jgi:hypothetical protein
MTLLQFLAGAIVLLQIVDGVTTYIALGKGDSESNRRAVWLFSKFGVLPTIIVSKALIAGLAVLVALNGGSVAYLALVPLFLLYAYVAVNNLDTVLG